MARSCAIPKVVPVIVGIFITFVLLGISGIFMGTYGGEMGLSVFAMIWLSGWTLGLGAILFAAITSLREGFRRKKAGLFIRGMFLSAFSIPFLGAEAVFIALMTDELSPYFTISLVIAFLMNVLFFRLMKNYTPEGRKLLDQIEGFRMYMSTAEKERIKALARVDMPEDTPRHFESLLPYAIALGVEKEWAARFDDVLKKVQYSPEWYSGTYPLYHMNAAAFMTGLSGGLGTAVASSSMAPGSSSGFGGGGGGGFSGGGGGGGGGGGW